MKMLKNLVAVAILGTSLLGCGTSALKATTGVAPKAKAPVAQSTIATGEKFWGIGGFSANGQFGNNFITFRGVPIQLTVHLIGAKDKEALKDTKGFMYNWIYNGQLISTLPTASFTFYTPGFAQVQCRVSDFQGQMAVGAVNFTVRRTKEDLGKTPADTVVVDDSFKVKGPVFGITL